MFKVGQRVTTTRDVIGGASSNRVVRKGATGTVHGILNNLIEVRIDGDRGFQSQNRCWRFSHHELSANVFPPIVVNKDAVHLLSKE